MFDPNNMRRLGVGPAAKKGNPDHAKMVQRTCQNLVRKCRNGEEVGYLRYADRTEYVAYLFDSGDD